MKIKITEYGCNRCGGQLSIHPTDNSCDRFCAVCDECHSGFFRKDKDVDGHVILTARRTGKPSVGGWVNELVTGRTEGELLANMGVEMVHRRLTEL